jgi:hypothetical protein
MIMVIIIMTVIILQRYKLSLNIQVKWRKNNKIFFLFDYFIYFCIRFEKGLSFDDGRWVQAWIFYSALADFETYWERIGPCVNSRKIKIKICGNADKYRGFQIFETLFVVLNVVGSSPTGQPLQTPVSQRFTGVFKLLSAKEFKLNLTKLPLNCC